MILTAKNLSASVLLAGLAAAALAIPGPPPATADAAPGAIPGSDRVYELVSPPDARGSVTTASLPDFGLTDHGMYSGLAAPLSSPDSCGDNCGGLFKGAPLATDGNIVAQWTSPQLNRSLSVEGPGPAVFWESDATPPGTGAVEDYDTLDSFRSVRTPSGWVSRDLLAAGQPPSNATIFSLHQDALAASGQMLLAVSADGSAALIYSMQRIYPDAYVDPNEPPAIPGQEGTPVFYRVSADGAPPQLVTRFADPIPTVKAAAQISGYGFQVVSASPDLRVVDFRSLFPLDPGDTCNATDPTGGHIESSASGSGNGPAPIRNVATNYIWRAASPGALARPAVDFGGASCLPPNIAGVPTILPDGRPIVYPSQGHQAPGDSQGNTVPGGNPIGPQGFDVGPLVQNSPDNASSTAFTPLTGPSGATFLTTSPDGSTAYVRSTDSLDANYPGASGANIYAVSTSQGTGWDGAGPIPAETPGVTCLSCAIGSGDATFVGLSADGSHLIFAASDDSLWSYDTSVSQPPQPLVPASDSPLIAGIEISHNGQHVAANTAAGWREYTVGDPSPASLDGCGTPAGVSDDGTRVVCDSGSVGHGVINEWVAGAVTQISPLSSSKDYRVQRVSGDQLRDVFFIARDILVPYDGNGGAETIYDARVDGGFPVSAGCSGDACQGTPASQPPGAAAPATAAFSGPGNPAPAHPKQCKKGQVKRNGRCAKKAGKRHHPRTANANRRPAK